MNVKSFGSLCHAARLEQGFTLAQACASLRVSPSYLSRIERDLVAPPSPDVIRAIASLYMIEERRLQDFAAAGHVHPRRMLLAQVAKITEATPAEEFARALRGIVASLDICKADRDAFDRRVEQFLRQQANGAARSGSL